MVGQMSPGGVMTRIDHITAMWLDLAESGAALIRDGSRCRCQLNEKGNGAIHPDCPFHGSRPEGGQR
jgi:hypothetical protein